MARNFQKLGGYTPCTASLVEHVENDVEYGVRVFIRGQYGFQTSLEGTTAMVTPRFGIPASELPLETPIAVPLADGTTRNHTIILHGNPESTFYDGTCDGVWILCDKIYEERVWWASGSSGYLNSDIDIYLNGAYAERFHTGFQSMVKEVKIPYTAYVGLKTQIFSGADGLPRKHFLIAAYETGLDHASDKPDDGKKLEYFLSGNDQAAREKRIAYFNGTASSYWTRSPYIGDHQYTAIGVHETGGAAYAGRAELVGVRPVMILPNDLLLDPIPNPDGSYSPIL